MRSPEIEFSPTSVSDYHGLVIDRHLPATFIDKNLHDSLLLAALKLKEQMALDLVESTKRMASSNVTRPQDHTCFIVGHLPVSPCPRDLLKKMHIELLYALVVFKDFRRTADRFLAGRRCSGELCSPWGTPAQAGAGGNRNLLCSPSCGLLCGSPTVLFRGAIAF